MSEASPVNPEITQQHPNRIHESTIREQLLWASAFPLIFFTFLSVLVVTTVFHQLMLTTILQRNTAIVARVAIEIEQVFQDKNTATTADTLLNQYGSDKTITYYWINDSGQVLEKTGTTGFELLNGKTNLSDLKQLGIPQSRLIQNPVNGERFIVSFAPFSENDGSLILMESWKHAIASTTYMQVVIISLLVLGCFFALYTQSLSIGRIMRPITKMVGYARKAVPGSLFRPMPEEGAAELRTLIKAFNQMVVRLAEQQTNLRQYAHKALLSQEEERQRLSHELHDGTVQDLVGLIQRIELCRNELDRDPQLARHRLEELHNLLQETLRDVRQISNALRPSILEDLGLPAALHSLCNDLEQQMPSIRCQFEVKGKEQRLTPYLELAVFRVVQEALNNIRKHARQSTNASVELLFQESQIEAKICNNGPAIAIPNVRNLVRNGHLGLAGMYERARLFRGELDISSTEKEGTVVHLHLPYPPELTDTIE